MKIIKQFLFILPFFVVQGLLSEESLGNLAQYPPTKIDLTVTTTEDGLPILKPMQLNLLSGNYYRLGINCLDVKDDLTGWRIEMSELLT